MTQRRPPGLRRHRSAHGGSWSGELMPRGLIRRRSVNRSDCRPQVPTLVRRGCRSLKRWFILPRCYSTYDFVITRVLPNARRSPLSYRVWSGRSSSSWGSFWAWRQSMKSRKRDIRPERRLRHIQKLDSRPRKQIMQPSIDSSKPNSSSEKRTQGIANQ